MNPNYSPCAAGDLWPVLAAIASVKMAVNFSGETSSTGACAIGGGEGEKSTSVSFSGGGTPPDLARSARPGYPLARGLFGIFQTGCCGDCSGYVFQAGPFDLSGLASFDAGSWTCSDSCAEPQCGITRGTPPSHAQDGDITGQILDMNFSVTFQKTAENVCQAMIQMSFYASLTGACFYGGSSTDTVYLEPSAASSWIDLSALVGDHELSGTVMVDEISVPFTMTLSLGS